MENPNSFPSLKTLLATTLVIISIASVNAQISTPCTASMITSFTPCINFITGSSGGGPSPTAGCCDSLRSLMSISRDCTCLIITGNVPFSLPINRTLAISLPRACQSSGVPIQCKGTIFKEQLNVGPLKFKYVYKFVFIYKYSISVYDISNCMRSVMVQPLVFLCRRQVL